jgi:acyl carrier protein
MNRFERKIINAIAKETGIDKKEITLGSNLYDIGIDSLSALELLVALEDKYDIRIPEDQLNNLTTVREIVKVVQRNVSAL